MNRRAAARRRGVAAYTVMEIMMALSVLSIGATGIIAMQKAAAIGNMRARDLATANAIASAWLERLRTDGQRWLANDPSTIAQTTWLSTVGTDFPTIAGDEGVWLRPADIPTADISAQADVRGHDTFVAEEAAFCTHIRLTQLLPKLIRAEVRVFWLRRQGGGTLNAEPLCSADAGYVSGVGAERERYHFVYATTGILPTQRND